MNGAELAAVLGVTASTISRLRSGDRNPSIELMRKIESLLGWSVGEQASLVALDEYRTELDRRMEATPRPTTLARLFVPCGACGSLVTRQYGCPHFKPGQAIAQRGRVPGRAIPLSPVPNKCTCVKASNQAHSPECPIVEAGLRRAEGIR